ncbi:MAG: hypothetical protein R3B70_12135 [Polyangiaceae bacterium]
MRPFTPKVRPAARPSLLLAAAAGLALSGCGAGVASKADAPRLTDERSALDELTRAENEITALLGPEKESRPQVPPSADPQPAATAGPVTASEPASAPPPPQEDAVQQQPMAAKGAVKGAEDSADPCQIAWRALQSMENAAGHLCGLSSEADPTCTSARERVQNARARVSARCPR